MTTERAYSILALYMFVTYLHVYTLTHLLTAPGPTQS